MTFRGCFATLGLKSHAESLPRRRSRGLLSHISLAIGRARASPAFGGASLRIPYRLHYEPHKRRRELPRARPIALEEWEGGSHD